VAAAPSIKKKLSCDEREEEGVRFGNPNRPPLIPLRHDPTTGLGRRAKPAGSGCTEATSRPRSGTTPVLTTRPGQADSSSGWIHLQIFFFLLNLDFSANLVGCNFKFYV
jgi:hypothetical protein